MISPLPAVIFAALLPTSVFAEATFCPTTLSDSEALHILWNDQSTSTITRSAEGVSTEITHWKLMTEEVEHATALHGYLVLGIEIRSPSQTEPTRQGSYIYAPDQSVLLMPGEVREVVATFTDLSGSETGRLRFEAGQMGRLTIGPCALDSYPINITYLDMVPVHIERFDYIPTLGTAFFHGAYGSDGSEIIVVRPVQVSVKE